MIVSKKRSSTPKLFLAVALFLAASLFAVISVSIFDKNRKSELLVVSIAAVVNTDDGYIVRGNIRNFSDSTYSVPDLVFIIKGHGGEVLNQISKLPPYGMIDPVSDIEFIKKLEPKVPGAQKISVEFAKEN